MNPTGDSTQVTEELVFLRFQQPFAQTMSGLFGLPETWMVIPLVGLILLALAVTITTVGWRRSYRAKVQAGQAPRVDSVGGWLKLAAAGCWVLVVGWLLAILFVNDTLSGSGPAGPGAAAVAGRTDRLLWSFLTGGVVLFGSAYAIAMYVRDTRSVRWYWAAGLAALRITVYALLGFAFLLPAYQTFDKTEKHSRVVILLDVSPSMTAKSDEVGAPGGRKPRTRIETVIDFLTDDNVAFVRELLKNNPVLVYRFGNRLDDDPQVFGVGDPAWAAQEWRAFAAYDFKPFLLKGLSPPGRDAVVNSRDWGGERPGTPEWAEGYFKVSVDDATPAGLSESDREVFRANWQRLSARIEVARTIVQGTNVIDSVSAAVNRETGNMVQGIVVFTDGRSNLGSGTGLRELRARASKEKIPLFTVAVGDDRETASIAISGIQAPESTPPDEPFKLIVEADGVNLANQPATVYLDVFLPGKDPKSGVPPDATLSQTLPFAPGDPPHLQAEFVIDPDKVPEALTEVKDGKRVLKQGPWTVRARIPRDPKEATAEAEHVFERQVLVQQKPMKVLLVASGPSLEYHKLRDLLVRETQAKRAELSILLQAPLEKVITDPTDPSGTKKKQKEALKGIVQDVDENRLLVRFPDRLEVGNAAAASNNWEAKDPDFKLYNLNEYDLVITVDMDWSGIDAQTADNLLEWVTRQGGGLIFVAGPIKTGLLARVEPVRGGKNSHLRPVLAVLPVIPDDIEALQQRNTPRTPRRLYFPGQSSGTPVAELMRLDESVKNDPTAGWERFFTDRDKYERLEDPLKELFPKRGFFSVYPVMTRSRTVGEPKPLIDPKRGGFDVTADGLKPGATLLAEFAGFDDLKKTAVTEPWLVVLDPVSGRGRSAFVGSGETYRMSGYERDYYDRFWIRLMKYVAGTRDVKAARGRVLLDKEYVSGGPIRIQAQLLNPKSRPYPPNEAPPRFRIVEVSPGGELKPFTTPFQMAARIAGSEFDGYYTGQIQADPRLFRTGEYRYRVVIDVPESPGDTLEGEFKVRPSNPELDNTRTDFAALVAMASDLDKDFEARITDDEAKKKLVERLPKQDGVTRLAFRLGQKDLLVLIPRCMTAQEKNDKVLGRTDDLWDRGFTVPQSLTSWAFSEPQTLAYLLLIVVGLLSAEWLTRKLLRLA
jgi:hypothetical protein